MPWLTPDGPIPSGKTCRLVRVPDGIFFIADFYGAVLELAQSFNWETFGTLTPQECADAFFDMWRDMTDSGDWCMIGAIFAYATVDPPSHALPCDGATYLRTDFPALYDAIDPLYRVDADHFNVPDLVERFPLGASVSSLGPFPFATIGGEVDHVLTVAELAAHTHSDSGHAHSEGTTTPTAITIGPGAPAPAAIGVPGVTGSGSASITSTGADSAHNNMPPYIALRWAIMYE
jgi:microcystin-dependent protein